MGFGDVDDMPLPHLVVLGFGDRYLRVSEDFDYISSQSTCEWEDPASVVVH